MYNFLFKDHLKLRRHSLKMKSQITYFVKKNLETFKKWRKKIDLLFWAKKSQ